MASFGAAPDASRQEVEGYAADLIGRIHTGTTSDALEKEMRTLQVQKLRQFSNAPSIRSLVERSVAIVRGAPTLRSMSLAS